MVMVLVALFTLNCFVCASAAEPADYEVVPLPQKFTRLDGTPFTLDSKVQILAPASLQREAEFLQQYIKDVAAIDLSIAQKRIKNIRYFASQPWPYPAGIMVGFTAEYESGELRLQREELGGGGWYTRDNLPEIPNRSSLARWLIDDWLMPEGQ